MPKRVRSAVLLAFALHGLLILTARYRLSYDAYNHMFFADHYRLDWWSLWEPRWYAGFEVVSYPPLVHQLVAVIGQIVGIDAAYGIVLWATLTAFPLAVFAFARTIVGRAAAGHAAYATALLPSLFLAGHVFGQLPSLTAALLALFGAAVLADYLQEGRILTGVLAVFLFAAVIAAHHATLLFLPFLVGIVAIGYLVRAFANTATFGEYMRAFIARLSLFGLGTALLSWLVIFPFWQWGMGQIMQTPIDHASRHNFIRDPYAALLFFLPVYGLLILFIPFALRLGFRRRFWSVGLAFLSLFLLGLGGTTPLPGLVFGPGAEWLTYDRFAFWASLLLVVFWGVAVVLLKQKIRGALSLRVILRRGFLISMVFIALLISLIPTWLPTQPRPLDMQPVVDFLAQGEHAGWRYLTFGFGDQLAYLSRLTDATTIDGSYHTARTLPELRSSGIAQIDTAYWIPGGLEALEPILQKAGDRGVRWGFVNLKLYEPVLSRNGWRPIGTLSNGVGVWENPEAIPPPPVTHPKKSNLHIWAWGALPLTVLSISIALAALRYLPVVDARLASRVQEVAIGTLPFGLSIWFYFTIYPVRHERIYFTYSDALFFLGDGIALIAVLAWLAKWPVSKIKWRHAFSHPGGWLILLFGLVVLSIGWTLEWRTTLYLGAHFLLSIGLYLSLRDSPGLWRPFITGCAGALILQIAVGVGQFIFQSTSFSAVLSFTRSLDITSSMSGASVVQLADGTRWLRAYGTLPHPNVLAGFTLIMLAAISILVLLQSEWRILSLILFNLGLSLMVLTFSRSAWLGLIMFGAILLWFWRRLKNSSLLMLAGTAFLCLVILFVLLQPLFVTRITGQEVQTEQVSNFTRFWLIQRTLEIIRENPILGVGVGSYSLALSRHVASFYDIEPVHNLPLLIWSELGILGVIASIGLVATVVVRSLKARRPLTIIFSATLVGLFTVSLFDHYLWTLAPGRLMLASVLGLWAGQVKHERTG